MVRRGNERAMNYSTRNTGKNIGIYGGVGDI